MSSPEPLRGALAGFTLMRFLVFYILANWFPKHRTARTSKLEYSVFYLLLEKLLNVPVLINYDSGNVKLVFWGENHYCFA